jgi:hypothetical protein
MARRDRDSRIFITLSVDMSDHPKFAPLTKGQKWLIAEAMMYCRKYLTDGCIEMPVWRKMDTKRNREAVEQTGVCIVVPTELRNFDEKIASDFCSRTGEKLKSNCVYFPTYFDHQQSRAEVEAYLEKRRSAGRKGGEAKAANRPREGSETLASATASAVPNAYQTPSKSVAESESESEVSTYVDTPPVNPPRGATRHLQPIDGGAAKTPARRETRKRGTRLPDGWYPPREVSDQMLKDFPNLDLRSHHGDFCDHWHAKPGRDAEKLDWVATWRKWMRKEGREQQTRLSRRGGLVAPTAGTALSNADLKRARAEALKDCPNPDILAAAGIELTDTQRTNLGMVPAGGAVIDADGFEYNDSLPLEA